MYHVSKHDTFTWLHPFMTAAVTKQRPLDLVYIMAMADPSLIVKEKKRSLPGSIDDVIDNNKSGSAFC